MPLPTLVPISGGALQPVAIDWLYEVRTALEARHWLAAAQLGVALERETLDDDTARAFAADLSAQSIDATKSVERYKAYVTKRDALTEKSTVLDGFAVLVEARIESLKRKRRDLVVAVLKDQIAQLTDAADAHADSRDAIVARRDALLDELYALEPPPGARAAKAGKKAAPRRAAKARKASTRKAGGKSIRSAPVAQATP